MFSLICRKLPRNYLKFWKLKDEKLGGDDYNMILYQSTSTCVGFCWVRFSCSKLGFEFSWFLVLAALCLLSVYLGFLLAFLLSLFCFLVVVLYCRFVVKLFW